VILHLRRLFLLFGLDPLIEIGSGVITNGASEESFLPPLSVRFKGCFTLETEFLPRLDLR
jgi:hypothetical protein